MIIEIKDLPPGRNVKRINVDVTFEDVTFEDGEPIPVSKSDSSTVNVKEVEAPPLRYISTSDDTIMPDVPTPAGPIYNDDRPKKEIPQEMLDLEL